MDTRPVSRRPASGRLEPGRPLRPRVLVADDESSVLNALRKIIERLGCDVTPVRDGQEALQALQRAGYELVVTDLRMPEADGMQVVQAAMSREPAVPVIVVTADSTMGRAVEAMRLGAANYLTKPFDVPDVERIIKEALSLPGERRRPDDSSLLLGRSPAIAGIRAEIERVAAVDLTVLLTGERGTGKEVAARLLHERSGRRGPFIPVECAAKPEAILLSELFGQTRIGRIAQAAGGTLFLAEVGDMAPALQAKLLRFLESRELEHRPVCPFKPVGAPDPIGGKVQRVDVRVVAATSRGLDALVRSGQLDEALLRRLSGVLLRLPPLRDRLDDIPLLCQHFLGRALARRGHPPERLEQVLAPSALQRLREHAWPENVHELETLIERVVLLRRPGQPIEAGELPLPSSGGVRRRFTL